MELMYAVIREEWSLGCVNPASWLPLAAGDEFTQPRARLFGDPCISGKAHCQSETNIVSDIQT